MTEPTCVTNWVCPVCSVAFRWEWVIAPGAAAVLSQIRQAEHLRDAHPGYEAPTLDDAGREVGQ